MSFHTVNKARSKHHYPSTGAVPPPDATPSPTRTHVLLTSPFPHSLPHVSLALDMASSREDTAAENYLRKFDADGEGAMRRIEFKRLLRAELGIGRGVISDRAVFDVLTSLDPEGVVRLLVIDR